MIEIRQENEKDYDAIYDVVKQLLVNQSIVMETSKI